MSTLTVSGLVVRYGGVTAVDGVSFTVEEGSFVSLLGPSGCGKTTTLRCIAGLESLAEGEIRIGDEVVARQGREVPPERRGVNMVFQSYAVWPHMSVFENVAYGLRTRRAGRAEIAARVGEALRLVGLEAFAARFGTELSGGQQQRVAVARAIVTDPRLLLFDEPLSNLDAGLRERMRFELLALQRRLGRTSVYVTHDQAEAMVMSDRIILMQDGRIMQEGTPRALYERPHSRFAASFVGNANLFAATVTAAHPDGSFTVAAGEVALRGFPSRPDWRPGAGGAALVCVRPENIHLVAGDVADGFAASLTGLGYLGAVQTCSFAAGELALRADLPSRLDLRVGMACRLRIPPDCVVLLPEELTP
jgi:ABC-type Fe3+/spermidine/putrescine transport system ATPase subunit